MSASSIAGAGQDARPPNLEGSTRARMIAAVMECILTRGYYRATTNEITRTAGFTWGAIQRQFGNREALMVAALEAEWVRLIETWRGARIEGNSIEQRTRSLFDTISRHYSRPEFMAAMQILTDLRSTPATSEATHETIRRLTSDAEAAGIAMLHQAFGDRAQGDRAMLTVFYALRDHCIGLHISSLTASRETYESRLERFSVDTDFLIRALAAAMEEPRAPSAGRAG